MAFTLDDIVTTGKTEVAQAYSAALDVWHDATDELTTQIAQQFDTATTAYETLCAFVAEHFPGIALSLTPGGVILTTSLTNIIPPDAVRIAAMVTPSVVNAFHSKTYFYLRNSAAVASIATFTNVQNIMDIKTVWDAPQIISSSINNRLLAYDWYKWYIQHGLLWDKTPYEDVTTYVKSYISTSAATACCGLAATQWSVFGAKWNAQLAFTLSEEYQKWAADQFAQFRVINDDAANPVRQSLSSHFNDPLTQLGTKRSPLYIMSDYPVLFEYLNNVDIAKYGASPFFDSLWIVVLNDIPAAFYDESRVAHHYLRYLVDNKMNQHACAQNAGNDCKNEYGEGNFSKWLLDYKKNTNLLANLTKDQWHKVVQSHMLYLARNVGPLPNYKVNSQIIEGPTRKFSLPQKDGVFSGGGRTITVTMLALQSYTEFIRKLETIWGTVRYEVSDQFDPFTPPMNWVSTHKIVPKSATADALRSHAYMRAYMFSTYELFYLMRQAVSNPDGVVFYPYDYMIDSFDVALLTPGKNIEHVFRFYDAYVSDLSISGANLSYTAASELLQIKVEFTYNNVELISGFDTPLTREMLDVLNGKYIGRGKGYFPWPNTMSSIPPRYVEHTEVLNNANVITPQ